MKLFDKEKKEKEKSQEKFDKKLSQKLASAATAKSWSDLLPLIKDMQNYFNLNNEYDFNKISDKLLLGKRLAQCLNPECPGGLHDVTVEVYEILLKNIMAKTGNKLMENLHIYAYGLFPFFPNATLQNKKKFLEKIVKGIFDKINEEELKLCLPGLLSSLIPGLDDNNEETTKLIYSSFNDLTKKDERNFFGVYWMLLLRCKHLRNSGIKYLLEKVDKYIDFKSNEEKIKKQFPNVNTTVVNALSEIIKDKDVPLVRNGMDFITSRLPLSKENTIISDEAKINLINSSLYLFVKNDYSCIRRLKCWILGIDNQDDEVDYNSEDMKYKMGLVISAFENLFQIDYNLELESVKNTIKNNISILERFLDLEEEFVNQILPSIAFPALKSVVSFWEKFLDSSEDSFNNPIISQITTFFNKKKQYFESLWKSLASSIIIELDKITNIDEILSPLKFCLRYINIESDKERIKFYIPIITNILNLIKQMPLKREEFKTLKKVSMVALGYIRTLQETKFQEEIEQEEDFDFKKNIPDTKGKSKSEQLKKDLNTAEKGWTFVATSTMRKSVIDVIMNEAEDDQNEENKINDIYQISEESNMNSILNFDKNLLDSLSENISIFHEYFIGILNEFLNPVKEENKINQLTRFEIAFFRQMTELMIRLQEYNQSEGNDIPKWIKYLEKIIFNSKDNTDNDLLSFQAANILLDLNLSFSQKENEKDKENISIYTKIKNNFSSGEIDTQIIEVNHIDDIVKRMKVNKNCYELLLAKFYLLSNKQSHMTHKMTILYKIFNFDKTKFFDIIYDTLNVKENLYENIKLFNNFWKSVNEYYPDDNWFKAETVFKMLDFLEDRNPTLRHLSKTWLNQANQHFNKIIDPILLVLLDREIIFEMKKEEEGEPIEFIKEFQTTKILDALNKLKNIIINSKIMTFLKKDIKIEFFALIKFNIYSKSRMSYLQTLICTVLHFLRTKAQKDLNEDFVKEVFSLNAASTEFLEFLLKNINDYEFLIKNTKLINDTILDTMMKSLKQKDEVIAVQLLDVLKSLYFNYPPEIVKNPEYKIKYIDLLMNKTLENVIKEGMIFDHFYIREHFISFTKQLVETFFDSISIEDKTHLKNFYQLCNRFIEPLVNLVKKKVVFDNQEKSDTENFSHYDSKHNQIIYKNYCEEYKEYKTYDESEVLSILIGINDIISKCFTNQIQAKNKEMGTDKGIKFLYIPIPFIKKKAIMKTDFTGDWIDHKKKLANDIKTNNAFVSFMTTIFDFVDENPNKEIKDMSTNLYHNQIFNLLKSFLSIWINQSEKYEKYDYCLNSNGILPSIKSDTFKSISDAHISQAKENIKNNPIKSVIISISRQLFFTDSIKFIENIMSIWSQEQEPYKDEEEINYKDKQYKLSIIELIIAMEIPIDVILYCVGIYLQRTYNQNQKKYNKIKSKTEKYYETPFDASINEAKIFHFIYSYILLYPIRLSKPKEFNKTEIWKEMIAIMTNSLNETKILYSYCWLYEILRLTAQKFSPINIDSREIKNGIESIFNGLSSKLIDAVFNQKTDSKYNKDCKLTLPFLPHVYYNIVKEVYKGNNLYHKNLEGNKSANSDFYQLSFKSKSSRENLDKKMNLYKSVSDDKRQIEMRAKTINTAVVIIDINEAQTQTETESSIINFYKMLIDLPKTYNDVEVVVNKEDNDDEIDKDKLNSIYKFFAFITLKENLYPLIKSFFEDNIKTVSKYYNEIISKLLTVIKNEKSESLDNVFAHSFLGSLMSCSSKNVSNCGKDALMEYIKSPKLFKGTSGELHEWKNIIKLLSINYNDILPDLINDMNDKNIFVKKTEEEKCRILRRVSFLIYSCEKDHFSKNFALIKSKAKELLSDFSTNNNLEREIFLLLRMLFLKFSHDAVMQMIRDLWPIIFTELVKNINSFVKQDLKSTIILEPFKFIELLSLVNIEEFSLYQWIFMLDTFDIKDCDIRNNNSMFKRLLVDKTELFKPLAVEVLQKLQVLNIDVDETKKKAKSELIIDAENEQKFKTQLYEFFYSIGDMNSYKVEANYNQIAENIEKDFIDGTQLRKTKKDSLKQSVGVGKVSIKI